VRVCVSVVITLYEKADVREYLANAKWRVCREKSTFNAASDTHRMEAVRLSTREMCAKAVDLPETNRNNGHDYDTLAYFVGLIKGFPNRLPIVRGVALPGNSTIQMPKQCMRKIRRGEQEIDPKTNVRLFCLPLVSDKIKKHFTGTGT